MRLVEDVHALLNASPDVGAIMGLTPFDDFAGLAGSLFASLTANPMIGQWVASIYTVDQSLAQLSTYDIEEAARRNFELGGSAATVLFSRGAQAVMAHRVAHKLWIDGDTNTALALKSVCGRAFSTDIHPAARIGAGLWLDHGLGVVVGETSVIEDNVSIWHNVTLGSTLSNDGPLRHPHIGQGAVIGAGALVLGAIKIGAGANIGAGAIVLNDVADGTRVLGQKAQPRGDARIRFTNTEFSR